METRNTSLLVLTEEDRAVLDEIAKEIRMKKSIVPDVLVSNNEASRLLGVSYGTISKWVVSGKLERRTMGESTGILLSDILELKKKTRREA